MFVSSLQGWQPNKRPKKGYFPKKKRTRGQRRCGYCEKRLAVGLCVTRLRCTRFSRNEGVSGKPDAESLERNSKSSIHQSTLRHASIRDKKGPSLVKIQVKPRHQRSPYAIACEDRTHEETERQERSAPKQGSGSCQQYFQAQRERQSYILLACKVGSPSRESVEREFVVDSGASMHMVIEKDLKLGWVGDHEDIKEFDDGDDGQRRGANKQRSDGLCQTIGLIRRCCASSRNSQCLRWGNSAKNTGTRITGKAVKIHISSKMARWLIAVFQTMYHLWFLEYQRVLPQPRLHLPRHHLHHHKNQHRLTEIQYRKTEMLKLQYQKEVEVHKKKGIERSTKRDIAWVAWLATGIQGEFGWWKTLPVRFMNLHWSELGSGKHSVFTHFRKDSELWNILEDQNQTGFLQKTRQSSRATSGKCQGLDYCGSQNSQWRKWIAQQSSIRRCGTRFGNTVVTILPVQNKNFSGDPEEPNEVPGADEETKSDSHWQFLGIWQIMWRSFLESLYVNTTQIRNTWGLLVDHRAEWKKGHPPYSCNQVWTTIGRILWNVTAICETFKISCLMGRHPMEGGLECTLTDQWYRLEQWSNITLFLRKTSRDCISSAQKSPEKIFGCVLYAGRIWKWDIMVALKNWSRWTHLNSTPEFSMQRKCWHHKEVETSFFLVADGTVKIFGGERHLRTSTLTRRRSERGEESEIFDGNSDEWYDPSHLQEDSTRDDEEPRNDFWTITGEFIYRHHVVPRVKLYMPKEETFPIPTKYIDVTRTTHTSLDVLPEKHIDDYWNVDGERELSDARTGFTRFT